MIARAGFGLDNRGAMVRLIGGGTNPLMHLENRVGDPNFISCFLAVKQAEIDRFPSSVTDWEHREYFDLF